MHSYGKTGKTCKSRFWKHASSVSERVRVVHDYNFFRMTLEKYAQSPRDPVVAR